MLTIGRFCMTPNGGEVEVVAEGVDISSEGSEASSGENCHFHAGVE
jgi:zinc transporter 1/2/3